MVGLEAADAEHGHRFARARVLVASDASSADRREAEAEVASQDERHRRLVADANRDAAEVVRMLRARLDATRTLIANRRALEVAAVG